jgi:hypothetical protein
LAVRHGSLVRDVPIDELQKQLTVDGAILRHKEGEGSR